MIRSAACLCATLLAGLLPLAACDAAPGPVGPGLAQEAAQGEGAGPTARVLQVDGVAGGGVATPVPAPPPPGGRPGCAAVDPVEGMTCIDTPEGIRIVPEGNAFIGGRPDDPCALLRLEAGTTCVADPAAPGGYRLVTASDEVGGVLGMIGRLFGR